MLGSSLRYHWWSLILVFACVWSGKVFSGIRYYFSWIRLAETNPRVGHLVLVGLDLALSVVLGSRAGHTFGAWLFVYYIFRGQQL